MVKNRNICRAKTRKGKRCSRTANFIYCKQHWKSKIRSKYTFWGVITFVALVAGLYQDFISPGFKALSDIISPPNYWQCDQDQNIRGILLNDVYTKKKNEIFLLLGLRGKQSFRINSPSGHLKKEPSCILPAGRMNYECAIRYRLTKKKKLLVSADLFDVNHCLVGKISDNRFILNQDCGFTWNFDEVGFEVVDSDFNVVFSLHYYPPEAIAIQGVFYSGGELVCINDEGIRYLTDKEPSEIHKARKTVRPMFEYFDKDWFGKRNPKSSVVDQSRAVRRKPKPMISIPRSTE